MAVHLREVSPQWTEVEGVPDEVLRTMAFRLSYIDPRAKFSRTGWSGLVSMVEASRKGVRIPTGLIPHAQGMLEEAGLRVVVDYSRPELVEGPYPAGTHEFQKEAIRGWIRARGRGAVILPMGSGKTSYVSPAAIMAVRQTLPNSTALFIVDTLDLLLQASASLGKTLGEPVGTIGNGVADIKRVTVATMQSLLWAWPKKITRNKREIIYYPPEKKGDVREYCSSCELVILDECHIAQSTSIQQLFDEEHLPNSKYRLLLTGTYVSTNDTPILMDAVGAGVCHEVEYDTLIEHDPPILARPTFYFYWMPPQKLPIPDYKEDSPSSQYNAYYQAYIVNNEHRNRVIAKICKLEMEKGHSVAVIVTRVSHGEILSEMIGCPFLHGKNTADERYETWEELRNKDRLCVITTLLKKAVDIPSLDTIVYACAGDSEVGFPQSWRCMRSNGGKKTNCYIYSFKDHRREFSSHSLDQLNMCRKNGFIIKHINRPTKAKTKVSKLK